MISLTRVKAFFHDQNQTAPYSLAAGSIWVFFFDQTQTHILISIYMCVLACFWLIHNTKKELTRVKESVK